MPKDKDVKKLVRARMAKTGESYSIAKLRLARANKPQSTVARSSSASLEGSTAPAIYQMRISLSEIAPAIWRRLLVPADTSLDRFHHIIQAAFGWLNYHLHQYIVDERYFGDPDPEFAAELPPMTDERDATLRDIVEAKAIVYEYDFGDSCAPRQGSRRCLQDAQQPRQCRLVERCRHSNGPAARQPQLESVVGSRPCRPHLDDLRERSYIRPPRGTFQRCPPPIQRLRRNPNSARKGARTATRP